MSELLEISKVCTSCKVTKHASSFGKCRRTKDGISRICKACTNDRQRQLYHRADGVRKKYLREYEARNRGKANDRHRKSYCDNREREQVRSREKYKKLKSWYQDYQKKYREKHREQYRATGRLFQKTDKGKLKAKNQYHLRKQRKRLAGGRRITHVQWKTIREAFNGMCAWCRVYKYQCMDHVVPLAGGGLHCATNVVPSCTSCNLSKSNKDPVRWAAEIGADLDYTMGVVKRALLAASRLSEKAGVA